MWKWSSLHLEEMQKKFHFFSKGNNLWISGDQKVVRSLLPPCFRGSAHPVQQWLGCCHWPIRDVSPALICPISHQSLTIVANPFGCSDCWWEAGRRLSWRAPHPLGEGQPASSLSPAPGSPSSPSISFKYIWKYVWKFVCIYIWIFI